MKIIFFVLIVLGLFNFEKAYAEGSVINNYESLYNGGDVESAYKLGLIYYYGLNGVVNEDKNRGVDYLMYADNNGHIRSTALLGIHNFNYNNKVDAMKYFKKAAIGGDLLSMAYIGKMIESKSKEEAEKFYRKSIVGKSPKSYYFFGKFLIDNNRKGTVKSLEGYSLLISLDRSGMDVDMSVRKYLRVNSYSFSNKEMEIMKQFLDMYKI